MSKVKFIVHTTSGKEFESEVFELTEEQETKWAEVLCKLDDLSQMNLPQIHALGWSQAVYLNPKYIEAVQVIFVPERVE